MKIPYEIEKLVKERIEQKPFPKLDSETLQNLIKQHFDLKEFSVQEFSPFFRNTYLRDCADKLLTSIQNVCDNQGFNKSDDALYDYSFVAYRILTTDRNINSGIRLKNNEHGNFVVFEKSIGFITTDCAQLFLIIKILEGISEEEYTQHTDSYLSYVLYVKHFIEYGLYSSLS